MGVFFCKYMLTTYTPIGIGRSAYMEKLEELLEKGGIKKNITFLVISAIALVISMTGAIKLPFDAAYIAIVLCGIPIILEAVIGLVTAFDTKADVLVS